MNSRRQYYPYATFYNDQQKIDLNVTSKRHGRYWDLTAQFVLEFFKPVLVFGHLQGETVHSVFHLRASVTENA